MMCGYLYAHIVSILRDNDITGIIDHGFCVDHEAYGERIVHDLKPGGRDIPVTEDNKKEYVKYVFFNSLCNSACT